MFFYHTYRYRYIRLLRIMFSDPRSDRHFVKKIFNKKFKKSWINGADFFLFKIFLKRFWGSGSDFFLFRIRNTAFE